jgi:hypothetical protein
MESKGLLDLAAFKEQIGEAVLELERQVRGRLPIRLEQDDSPAQSRQLGQDWLR